MKLFTEFGSCWGGAIISPEAEAAGDGWQTAEHGVYCHSHGRRSKRLVKVRPGGGAVAHWKPKLNAISENSPVTEVNSGGGYIRPDGIGNKKPVKVKHRSTVKAAPPRNHAEDYRKSSEAMAIPAFSPTSFLF